MKGWLAGGGSAETRFKPGHVPVTFRPVGSERVDEDGYILIKVADPNKWMMKHRVVWEAVHGPVQAGYVIVFADGDRLNVSLENLMLVSRRELAVLNKNHLLSCDPEFSRAGLAVARLMIRKADRERENRKH